MRALIADAGANVTSKDNIRFEPREADERKFSGGSSDHSKPVEEATQIPGKEEFIKALERSKKRNASALGAPKVIIDGQIIAITTIISFMPLCIHYSKAL